MAQDLGGTVPHDGTGGTNAPSPVPGWLWVGEWGHGCRVLREPNFSQADDGEQGMEQVAAER